MGVYTPVIRLKTVVLPAPLGPIRPWICPGSMLRLKPCTARSPPKKWVIFFTSSREDIACFLCNRSLSPATSRPF
ncbi:hypothetical protein H206_05557 [Candidatus Electrothrix aarhusensis]|uniref:Uncharacterized protein n=1 Tax=Candidatus Electrothrix aarhusensis TaxID=1859131 RepID=A0A444J461_9BACT|nr:hypothetical protein H206_05557 [Candidatus Electrothrix aarhusensis]